MKISDRYQTKTKVRISDHRYSILESSYIKISDQVYKDIRQISDQNESKNLRFYYSKFSKQTKQIKSNQINFIKTIKTVSI